MEERNEWACLVDKQGKAYIWTDKTSVDFLQQYPSLIGYAQAVVINPRQRLQFYYQSPENKQWWAVSLKPHQDYCLPTPGNLTKSILPTFVIEQIANKQRQSAYSVSQKKSQKRPLVKYAFLRIGLPSFIF